MTMIYEPVDSSVTKLIDEVKETYFREIGDCRLTAIFDTREKRKKFIAKIHKSNDMLRFFTSDEAGEEDGYDFVIVVDQLVWQSDAITDTDRKRIIRHELRHISYNPEKKTRKGQYGICKHTIEDFYEEVDIAQQEGDPRWLERVKLSIDSVYDAMEDREI